MFNSMLNVNACCISLYFLPCFHKFSPFFEVQTFIKQCIFLMREIIIMVYGQRQFPFFSSLKYFFLLTEKYLLPAFQILNKNSINKWKMVLVNSVSVHMYIPVVSRLWPERLAGQPSIQEPLQGAVGVGDWAVV